MLNFNQRHAIALRMFVTILAANIAKVNELIIKHFADPKNNAVLLFEFASVTVTVVKNEGKLSLTVRMDGNVTHQIKLNNIKQPFSKRLVNDVEVMFHRDYRELYNGGVEKLNDVIDFADVKHKARNIPIMARIFNRPMEYSIKFNDKYANELLGGYIIIRRNIFNKLSVTVTTSSPLVHGLMRDALPTHIGVSKTYLADGKSDPVNQWYRQVLQDHVDAFFK